MRFRRTKSATPAAVKRHRRVPKAFRRELTYRDVFSYARYPGYVRSPRGFLAAARDLRDATPGLGPLMGGVLGQVSLTQRDTVRQARAR